LKLKGPRFDTFEEIQVESQRVLDTVTEKDFQEAFQKLRRRTGVYMWEGTTSRVMAADRPYMSVMILQRQTCIFWIHPRI
jgi:NADPH:quinone reductase-like Zn-dependent oxidoreductase